MQSILKASLNLSLLHNGCGCTRVIGSQQACANGCDMDNVHPPNAESKCLCRGLISLGVVQSEKIVNERANVEQYGSTDSSSKRILAS